MDRRLIRRAPLAALALFLLVAVSLPAQTQLPRSSKLLQYAAAVMGPSGKLDSLRATRIYAIRSSGGTVFSANDSLFIFTGDSSSLAGGTYRDTLIYATSGVHLLLPQGGGTLQWQNGFDITPDRYLFIRYYSQYTGAGRRISIDYR